MLFFFLFFSQSGQTLLYFMGHGSVFSSKQEISLVLNINAITNVSTMRMKNSATIKNHGLPSSQNKLAYFKISVVSWNVIMSMVLVLFTHTVHPSSMNVLLFAYSFCTSSTQTEASLTIRTLPSSLCANVCTPIVSIFLCVLSYLKLKHTYSSDLCFYRWHRRYKDVDGGWLRMQDRGRAHAHYAKICT